jgi:hypothetical protein
MIVTDDFVMLNFPKTGSSFARNIVKRVYEKQTGCIRNFSTRLRITEPAIQEVFCKHPFLDTVDQHGTYNQIPEKFRNRKVVSIVRDPVDRYESIFHYRWWAKNPPAPVAEIKKVYPEFPDISFDQFYEMTNTFGVSQRLAGINPKISLGAQTIHFIRFYFKNPDWVLENINKEYIEKNKFISDIAEVNFIHQENLNHELKIFLREICKINNKYIEFIDNSEKINKSDRENTSSLVSSATRLEIYEKEALLYKIFPEYVVER